MPPKQGYDWKNGPPTLDPHSRAKHQLLRTYLNRYIGVLLQNWKIPELRLSLVDAFAGGGCYTLEDGTSAPGSPLIMLNAVQEAKARLVQSRTRCKLDAVFYFVEKDRHARTMLTQQLQFAGYEKELGSSIHILEGTFAGRSEEILQNIAARKGGERAIFFLDQYGYTDAPLERVRAILSGLKGAEVILTIALDWLLDFIADTSSFRRTIQNSGLELDPEWLLRLKAHIPDEALIEGALHRHIVQKSGASYYTPFYLQPESHRKLWLFHLSKHPRARQEMAAVHWEVGNLCRHIGGAGLDQFAAVNALTPMEMVQPGELGPLLEGKHRVLGFGTSRVDPESMLLAMDFGDQAKERTRAALRRQLPELLHGKERLTMEALVTGIANHSPADNAIIQGVLNDLDEARLIRLVGAQGGTKRVETLKPDDVIELPKQLSVFDGLKLKGHR